MIKKIILVSGKAGSGKDTFAKCMKKQLEENYSMRVGISHYAVYLKSLLREFYQWNGEKSPYWRGKLQAIGTDLIRNKLDKPNYHVGRLIEDMRIMEEFFDYYIIPDLRFKNEVSEVEKEFGIDNVITIKIDAINNDDGIVDLEQKTHQSETDLDNYNFDYIVYNQKENISELEKMAKTIIELGDILD